MGILRQIIKMNPIGRAATTLYNVVDEGSVINGIKRTFKEDVTEDNPITSFVYKMGKSNGRQDGYVQASHEYEEKLLEQADLFLSQKMNFEKERNAYEELLDAYEATIEELQQKNERSELENELLRKLVARQEMLRNLE